MKLEIAHAGKTKRVELLDGVVTLGGSAADGIRMPGVSAALVELRCEAGRLVLVVQELFTVDGVMSPARVPRMVMPGERVELPGRVSLTVLAEQESRPPEGTAAVLKSLLGGIEAPQEMACASLTCLTGLDVARQFALAGGFVEIGRGDSVQIRIRDRAVSRRHARIRTLPDGYRIEDLGSPNGVYVNGRRLKGPATLVNGAVIELGRTVLRFKAPVHEGEERPPPPPPEALAEADAPPPPPPEAIAEAEAGAPPPPPPPAELDEFGPPPAAASSRQRMWSAEWALIGLGATLALVGAVVTVGFVLA